MAVKSCGSCMYFIKWKKDKYGGGLCEALDARTNAQYSAKKCKEFHAKRYKK